MSKVLSSEEQLKDCLVRLCCGTRADQLRLLFGEKIILCLKGEHFGRAFCSHFWEVSLFPFFSARGAERSMVGGGVRNYLYLEQAWNNGAIYSGLLAF